MSFDKYSDKAVEAIALIREFAKVEYWDFFKGDPEQALEAFCAMQDAAEEMGRVKASEIAQSQQAAGELPPLPEGTWFACDNHDGVQFHPSEEQAKRYAIDGECVAYFSADQMHEYARAALAAQRAPVELPVVKTWQERCSIASRTVARQNMEVENAMREEINDLRAALRAYGQRAAVAVPQWQPIETAPYHEPVLLWWRTCKTPSVGQWHSDGDCLNEEAEGWRCEGDKCIPLNQSDCTHWMPLPAAPGAAPSHPQQEAVPAEPPKIEDTDQARQYLLTFMREHFIDKTFGEYILTKLAGDFAWNLATAIAMSAAKEPEK